MIQNSVISAEMCSLNKLPSIPQGILIPELKLMLVGNSGIGKLSFPETHVKYTKKKIPLLGVEIYYLVFYTNRAPIKFNIWKVEGRNVSEELSDKCFGLSRLCYRNV